MAVELNGKIHVVLQSAEANQKKSDYVKESSSMHLAHQQLPKALQTFFWVSENVFFFHYSYTKGHNIKTNCGKLMKPTNYMVK